MVSSAAGCCCTTYCQKRIGNKNKREEIRSCRDHMPALPTVVDMLKKASIADGVHTIRASFDTNL